MSYRSDRDPVVPAWLSITLFLFASCGIVAYFVYSIGMTLLVSFNTQLANLLP
ncbi:MAG: hypothetical protein ACYSW3_02275 [Planctomycetota bacterium]|jgi:hypothetical protein